LAKAQVVSIEPVNDFITIQPALDFFDDKAILSVGAKWLYTYNNGDVKFETRPYCILSDGDKFGYSKRELARRSLFHVGNLDIPETRWKFEDIDAFSQEPTSKTFIEVYEIIRESLEEYMDFADERLYSLLSCFIIYSYFYPLFNYAPVMQLWGEFKTGKTKVCSLVEAMVFNPINSANISSASVFRLIESRRAIILLDESEDLLTADRARDIRNMLLAGTGKSGETYRQERGSFESFKTQSFKVFSPKLIANIAGIDLPALQSRIIRATMSGTANKKKANRVVTQEDKKWGDIRGELYRLCLTRYLDVIDIRDNFPRTQISGRTLGIWQGVLTIASLVEEEVFQELLTYARDNEAEIKSDIEEFNEEPRVMLEELLKVVEETGNDIVFKTPTDLLGRMGLSFNFTSKKDMAVKLGRLGFRTRVLYLNSHYARYYTLSKTKIEDIMVRSR